MASPVRHAGSSLARLAIGFFALVGLAVTIYVLTIGALAVAIIIALAFIVGGAIAFAIRRRAAGAHSRRSASM